MRFCWIFIFIYRFFKYFFYIFLVDFKKTNNILNLKVFQALINVACGNFLYHFIRGSAN